MPTRLVAATSASSARPVVTRPHITGHSARGDVCGGQSARRTRVTSNGIGAGGLKRDSPGPKVPAKCDPLSSDVRPQGPNLVCYGMG
jgi:hypothetical protein